MKKTWEAPQLFAVVHGSPEEAVLLTCYDSATCEYDSVSGGTVSVEVTSLS